MMQSIVDRGKNEITYDKDHIPELHLHTTSGQCFVHLLESPSTDWATKEYMSVLGFFFVQQRVVIDEALVVWASTISPRREEDLTLADDAEYWQALSMGGRNLWNTHQILRVEPFLISREGRPVWQTLRGPLSERSKPLAEEMIDLLGFLFEPVLEEFSLHGWPKMIPE